MSRLWGREEMRRKETDVPEKPGARWRIGNGLVSYNFRIPTLLHCPAVR